MDNNTSLNINNLPDNVYSIDVSSATVILIQKKEFKGRNYIDIRKHSVGSDGTIYLSKKGIMILESIVPKVLTVLTTLSPDYILTKDI